MAIETLREGDLVIARDEETGVSGVFPVTALMSRQAVDTLWLTLARADGATTRMGVTSEHPLFVTGEGWVSAGELAPGDQVSDAAFRALTVLTVKWDPAPRIVHNLEVAGAHTYFAGELEAWGHNSLWRNRVWAAALQFWAMCTNHDLQTGQSGFTNVLEGELDPDLPPRNETKDRRTRPNCPYRNERSRITKFLLENRRR